MATRPEQKLTYADYVLFPDDGRRWELIDGEAFVVPSPDVHHQDITGRIYRQIADHLDALGGGRVFMAPLDVLLASDGTVVVQPDIVFIADADIHVIKAKNIEGVPTWAIEVVSDPVRDKKVKRDLYMRHGVSEYWALDPDLRCVEIHRPGVDAVVAEPPQRPSPLALPGLEIDLAAVLRP
jgi:Uma2 family endonuclease